MIVAENDLYEAEDNLKRAIFPAERPARCGARASSPTDRPSAEPMPVDMDAAIQNALDEPHRHRGRAQEPRARRLQRRSYAKNQLLPQLDLVANYGGTGAGGTQLIRDRRSAARSSAPIPGGYGDAVERGVRQRLPHLDGRLQRLLRDPQPQRQGRTRPTAQLSKEQALASFRRLELQVAAEVRTAGRGVESGFKRVASRRRPRASSPAQRLDAEEKKFAAGMSTNFLVTQAQRDLAQAEVNELRAIADYRKSVINFQRVQEAGVSGTGAVGRPQRQHAATRRRGQALLVRAAAGVGPRSRAEERAAQPRRSRTRGRRAGPLFAVVYSALYIPDADGRPRPAARSKLVSMRCITTPSPLAPRSSWSSLGGWLLPAARAAARPTAVHHRQPSTAATSSRWWARPAPSRP